MPPLSGPNVVAQVGPDFPSAPVFQASLSVCSHVVIRRVVERGLFLGYPGLRACSAGVPLGVVPKLKGPAQSKHQLIEIIYINLLNLPLFFTQCAFVPVPQQQVRQQ